MKFGRQTGSALIVSLILLSVLTLLGVAGMGASILQERMAGNLQNSARVFAATESALRLCEGRALAGESEATGRADAEELRDFGEGEEISPVRAELYRPEPAKPLIEKGEYRLHCLIEFTGPLDGSRFGGSLRRPVTAMRFTGHRVTATGAWAQAAGAMTRPTVILQSDVIARR